MNTTRSTSKYFNIISPSGAIHIIYANDIFHAVSLAVEKDKHEYRTSEYLKLNKRLWS